MTKQIIGFNELPFTLISQIDGQPLLPIQINADSIAAFYGYENNCRPVPIELHKAEPAELPQQVDDLLQEVSEELDL